MRKVDSKRHGVVGVWVWWCMADLIRFSSSNVMRLQAEKRINRKESADTPSIDPERPL